MTGQLRVVSHGGGVQTTAMLVLAATRRIDYDTFLFANVGDDSEQPQTLKYLHEIATPYAEANGITIHELRKINVRGQFVGVESLYSQLTRQGSRSLPIPVRMSNGAPGTRRCTSDFKIKVIGKWLKEHGASADQPAHVAVGISVDEIGRATNRHVEPYEQLHYPLLDLKLRRDDCQRIIRDAGLPVPGKSSCWFCPFHRPIVWQDMSRQDPALFERACNLEDLLNERRDELGRDHVWLTRFNRPLRDVVMTGADVLPGMEDDDPHCDNGWCMT